MKKGAPQNKHGQPYSRKQKKASRFMNRFSTFQKRESSGLDLTAKHEGLTLLAGLLGMFKRNRG